LVLLSESEWWVGTYDGTKHHKDCLKALVFMPLRSKGSWPPYAAIKIPIASWLLHQTNSTRLVFGNWRERRLVSEVSK